MRSLYYTDPLTMSRLKFHANGTDFLGYPCPSALNGSSVPTGRTWAARGEHAGSDVLGMSCAAHRLLGDQAEPHVVPSDDRREIGPCRDSADSFTSLENLYSVDQV